MSQRQNNFDVELYGTGSAAAQIARHLKSLSL
jgi:hypothetical protein